MAKAKVALNGFGRIGRAAFKILLDEKKVEVVAVNDLVPPANLAYLLKYDTAYGRFDHEVEAGEKSLIVDGDEYPILSEKDPEALPWKDMSVDLVFECTGLFTTREDLEKHIKAGAEIVILSAPAKSEDVDTVVRGVNEPGEESRAISCASCTTNCITPVVEIMNRRLGVRKAAMTTIHAYTSTQSIVDGPAKKMRRGRAGAMNFVPTSTGAAVATTKVLPELKGRFNGVAVRGPVVTGSIADMVFLVKQKTSVEEVNGIFREESKTDRYEGILGASDDELVSSDIIGDPRASIVDLGMTQVVDGDLVKVMAWYDNEWGYANQMVQEGLRILRNR